MLTTKATRCGEVVLDMLATKPAPDILRTLRRAPQRPTALEQRLSAVAAHETISTCVSRLRLVGLVGHAAAAKEPGRPSLTLTPAGEASLGLLAALERWLAEYPDGPLTLATDQGRDVVGALAELWGSALIGELAAGPRRKQEIKAALTGISSHQIERRLDRLVRTHMAERRTVHRERVYEPGPLLFAAVVPLALAVRWELVHRPPQACPLTAPDVQTGLQLALADLEVPEGGTCTVQLDVALDDPGGRATVFTVLERGRIVASSPDRPCGKPHATIDGTATQWLNAIIEGKAAGLRFGGDKRIIVGLLGALHNTHFAGLGLSARPST